MLHLFFFFFLGLIDQAQYGYQMFFGSITWLQNKDSIIQPREGFR